MQYSISYKYNAFVGGPIKSYEGDGITPPPFPPPNPCPIITFPKNAKPKELHTQLLYTVIEHDICLSLTQKASCKQRQAMSRGVEQFINISEQFVIMLAIVYLPGVLVFRLACSSIAEI